MNTSSTKTVATNHGAFTECNEGEQGLQIEQSTKIDLPSVILNGNDFRWPKLDEQAFHGLAGEFIELVEPHTEADPAAILFQFLVFFGNVVGKGPYWRQEDTQHYVNLFVWIVGSTSKSRKGTAFNRVNNLFKLIDSNWLHNCIAKKLKSAPAIVYRVRDRNGNDPGVSDKRLLWLEGEAGHTLTKLRNEDFCATFCLGWDGDDLCNTTLSKPLKATSPHVSFIAHSTTQILKRKAVEAIVFSGCANRVLWVGSSRKRLLPKGGNLSKEALEPLAKRLKSAIQAAAKVGQMDFTPDADARWIQVYGQLSITPPGLVGEAISRGEAQVRRLACIYALLDKSEIVDIPHLDAALACWNYAAECAYQIFPGDERDADCQKVIEALTIENSGLTRTQISHKIFLRNRSSTDIEEIKNRLLERRIILVQTTKQGSRAVEVWRLDSNPSDCHPQLYAQAG